MMYGTYIFVLARPIKKICIQLEKTLVQHSVRTNLFPAAAKDYRAIVPRIVHFPGEAPDTSRQCITIDILDDEEFEGEKPESLSLSLSVQDIAVVVSTSSATVFIVDDETDGGM